jgi:multidrug efflux pump subunit AcrA (membrane-fusion protein)
MSVSASANRGFTSRGLLIALVVVVALPAIAWSLWPKHPWGGRTDGPTVHQVERSRFVHETTERGNVESASNIEIRCEVQSKNAQGTTILEIIPEGTYVQPGDILAQLDKSQLENDLIKQQIVCSNSEAALIKATNDFATAQIAKREYEEGTFRETEQQTQSEISTAQENLRRARDYLEYSERLALRGYVTQLQLEADRFAVEKAKTDQEVAETKLRVLRDFTKAKMINQLESAIATSEAAMKAAERSHQLDLEQQKLIETQIEKCTIKAPEPGQVVYASESAGRGGGRDILIQEGEQVRERQVIIRLPDPKRMQVKARINEARVSMVTAGQHATIRMDAFSDLELTGTVEKVNEYPAPTSWMNPNVKEYDTIVKINESPAGLRPGLTAEVKILIEQIEDAIHVPHQSVFEYGGRYYCVMRGEQGDFQAHPVEVGASNDKTIVIRDGLDAGQFIVLNAASYRDRIALPALTPEQIAASQPKARGGPAAGAAAGGPAGAPAGAAPNPAAMAEQLFSQYDKNRDGRIELDQVPEPLLSRLKAADANGDGLVDRVEFNSAAGAMMRRPAAEGAANGDAPGQGRPRGPRSGQGAPPGGAP